jgi:hypothetical protein
VLAVEQRVAASRNPPCISTTVPYWSNMQILMRFLSVSMAVMAGFLIRRETP